MISDVLFDAVQDIERYERDMPEWYGSLAPQIAEAKTAMEKLRVLLDTPPADDSPESTAHP